MMKNYLSCLSNFAQQGISNALNFCSGYAKLYKDKKIRKVHDAFMHR
jgi:hypothetical protein